MDTPQDTSMSVTQEPRLLNIGHMVHLWQDDDLREPGLPYRYRSYFYISWKPVSSENCEERTFSFTSFISIISKCSKKLTKTQWCAHDDGGTRYYEYQRSSETCDFEPLSKNLYKLDSDDRRYSDDNRNHIPIISPNSKENDNSRPSNFKEENSTKCTVLTAESNDSTVPKSNNSPTSKSKRNVCVQTSGRHRSHKKSSKYVENSEKENLMIPTRTSSSKDVKTIFKVNDADFNDRKSKTNLKELKTRQRVKKTTDSKPKKRVRKSKEHPPKDLLKNVRNTTSIMSFNEENMSCHFGEDLNSGRSKDSDRFLKKNRNRFQTTSNINSTRTSKDTICKSMQLRSYRSCSSTDSPKVANATRTPRNYFVENKTSEIMILGNIKKRLEEDYDEYFSVNEIDLEDLVEPGTPRKSWTNQRSVPSSETRIDQCSTKQTVRTSRSMLMMAKYQESQNHVWHSTLQSVGREESDKRSIRASLSYNSAHCSNLDLVRSQSSYYHSVREDVCTPSSSIEYCSASSVSLSKFHSSLDNSIDAALQTCSLDTDISYDRNFNPSTGQTLLSTDISFEDNKIDKTDKEFLNETVVNSFTVCCCQRNSTPNLSNSSRRISESLDSGILTDYSRDCLRASEERLKRKKRKKWEKLRCGEREMDLRPTYDFNTDSSYSDDSLDRRVDVAVKKFTENLILTERKAKIKLRRLQNPARLRQKRKRRKGGQVKKIDSIPKCGSTCEFDCSQWQYDDDRFLSSSTPPVFSFSDSEIDHL